MTERIIPADFVRRALALSRRRGVDLDDAAHAAGITDAQLADPLTRLTPAQVTAFTQNVWAVTDDELFGLASAPVRRGTFRVVCLTLIHSPDLRSALVRMSDVMRALPALPMLQVEPKERTTRITIVMDPVDESEDALEATRVITDFLLILLHRFAAWLIGRRVQLHAVELPFPQPVPQLASNYDHIFGAPVTFGCKYPALEFDSVILRAPIIQTEDTLEEYLRRSPTQLLSERDYDSTAAAQVRRVLEHGVKGRTSTAEEIAETLSISVPHLRRLLRQDGTSLNQIREEVLRDTATAALGRGESVEVLSRRLGFSEPSAFRRAFKRWTGTTPSSYR
ncbi:AraC family transcriptional regulator [Rhodococcus sp. HNM0569]|uniref:AraC family transcriptional regulator ligand-binding domain-containing protein n=1 Tax=Rhodococcus sp. HNM0569 TaxID=2716340 RepID=UPI00146A03C9|nr:AraC family transcriptional regulator [Rhodococcus sp. HNM0569]